MDIQIIYEEWEKYCDILRDTNAVLHSHWSGVTSFAAALHERGCDCTLDWASDLQSVTINNTLVLTVPNNTDRS